MAKITTMHPYQQQLKRLATAEISHLLLRESTDIFNIYVYTYTHTCTLNTETQMKPNRVQSKVWNNISIKLLLGV